ncbi:MAG: TIGR02678 family protein, partial [Polyangiaceae bacterium]|nr:TIGR02678 family protein [Polyangiaceae bacterium]
PGHEAVYVGLALDRLFALDLARELADGTVRPMPAIARYALVAPEARVETRQGSLDV